MIIFLYLGIIISVFQLVILREFTFSIAKNELAFVVGVGLWLAACALGSLICKKYHRQKIPTAVALSLIFCSSISAIHLAKSFSGLSYYETNSFSFSFFATLILISPLPFYIGFSFTNFVREILEKADSKKLYAEFFAFEAMGFFIGSLIFTFLLSGYSNPFIFSLFCLLLLMKAPPKRLIQAIAIIAISLGFFSSYKFILNKEFKGARILQNTGSPYGPLLLTESNGVISLFSSGSLLATSEDKLSNEEFIHMGLSAIEDKQYPDILFIGSPVSGQIQEIDKYHAGTLDCVQINPMVSNFIKMGLSKKLNSRVNLILNDPRAYLKRTAKHYDAILISLPPPASLSINRYYTEEFFRLISMHLNKNGVLILSIPSKREILSPQIARFDSSIINSLDSVFPRRLLIPSDSMIIIAANERDITASGLLENFSKSGVKTDFFTVYHFKDYLNPQITDYIEKMLDKAADKNTDLGLSGFLNYLLVEQAKFYSGLDINPQKSRDAIKISALLIIAFAIILSFIVKKTAIFLNLGLTGFSSIGLTSIIFVLFQLYSGALFYKAGILVALFMLGLSLWTLIINSIMKKKEFHRFLLSGLNLAWTVLLLSLFFSLKRAAFIPYPDLIFYLYSTGSGMLTGAAYPIMVKYLLRNDFKERNITASVYISDLSGAFLGTITCGILFLPFLGVNYSLLILAGLNIAFCLRNSLR